MIDVPSGSIYFWMFSMGLKHIPLADIIAACTVHGKDVRQKDIDNYYNGYYRSAIYGRKGVLEFPPEPQVPASKEFFELDYEDYPVHPYLGLPEIENRYVPCNKNNKPMIKWAQGCLSIADASCYPNSVYLGENLCGCKFIVFDCDGDHTSELDMETIDFMWEMSSSTHTMMKPKDIPTYEGYEGDTIHAHVPASFHLTFRVDRVIPTMHFPKSHIDIVGNKRNSLRYFKNKVWNGKDPIDMTSEIWSKFKNYIRYREEG